MTRAAISYQTALDALTVEARKIAETSLAPFRRPNQNRPSIYGLEPLAPQELLSIHAVLAYVAHNQNTTQEHVQEILEMEFSVDHLQEISRQNFRSAIEFLLDLRMDEIRSHR